MSQENKRPPTLEEICIRVYFLCSLFPPFKQTEINLQV